LDSSSSSNVTVDGYFDVDSRKQTRVECKIAMDVR
jgi:hypothetical protein